MMREKELLAPKGLNVLHVVLDDKFTDTAINSFEKANDCNNSYWVFTQKIELTFIKSKNVVIQIYDEKKLNDVVVLLNQFDLVILHSLNAQNVELISLASDETKFLWIGMGYDYYDLMPGGYEKLLYPETKKFFFGAFYTLSYLRYKYYLNKNKFKSAIGYEDSRIKSKRFAIPKIEYFAPVLESEHSMIEQQCRGKFPKYIDWNYDVSVDSSNGQNKLKDDANNILLGNSGDPTNNHIEVLRMLDSLGVNDKKIIMPLSYGVSSQYKCELQTAIDQLKLKNNVDMLDSYLTFDAYIEKLKGCSNLVMNHIRQQAGGNILVSMLMGARVFLNDRSPFYHFYKSKGAFIFSLEDLKSDSSLLNKKLDEKEIIQNQKIVESEFSSRRISKKTQDLINHMKNENQIK